jgi:ribosomal protein S12
MGDEEKGVCTKKPKTQTQKCVEMKLTNKRAIGNS